MVSGRWRPRHDRYLTRTLYPPIEPYRTHRFEVGGGHNLYVEEVGDPHGVPAVFLHGGPGGGTVPAARRFFDPARYRTVLVDQRGSGRSTPRGSLHENTTAHLVADLEVVRDALGIPAWLLQLLDGVGRLRHLPCVIVQGRYDLCCPPDSAYALARRWPEAELHMIADAGHSSLEPGVTDRLIRATDAFAELVAVGLG